ncbi:MAG: DUF6305 family protein [Candidatus Hatepunaea meridiana]|nr:DUF6305 family protein [Candidatus Hatepunaea meridiana]
MKYFTIILLTLSLTIGVFASDINQDSSKAAAYKQPVLLTSVGQAADVLILKGLSLRAGVKVMYRPQATADSLSDCSTVLLVAGGSSKGLGAAKIDPDIEMKRIKGLVKAAKKAKIPILVYHIGGEARRGALSDQFNKLAAEAGEQLIVVKSGDKDEFFMKTALKNKAEYISIEKQIDVVGTLKKQFGL